MLAVLSQSLFYLPGLAAYVVAFVLAFFLHPTHPRAARMLGAGAAAQVLAAAISFTLSSASVLGALDAGSRTLLYTGVGLTASVVRACGEVLVIGAVWVAARGAPAPAPKDPYGY